MFSVVGYRRTSAAAVEGLLNLTPLTDPLHRIEGNYLFVGELNQIAWAYVLGTQVDNARLDSPSLRDICLLDLNPVDVAAEPLDVPQATDLTQSPLALETMEGLGALTDNNAAAAVDSWVILALANSPMTRVAGQIHTVKATAAATLVANAWTGFELTFGQTLPVGVYALVGAMGISTGLIAFRFVPIGQSHRPGGIGGDTYLAVGLAGQRSGGWGEWLRFNSHTPPSVEFLSVSADTAEEVWLDLIKVG